MASLPTTYTSQRFGRKSLDFYNASGDVIGADPRARPDERRLQDFEGARHTVRLMETGFRLEPGDHASVLRMQPGPTQRSRPVAVVNHTSGEWARTHPGASGLLARAGVARAANWVMSLMLFAVAALVAVWPYLQAVLVEINPSAFAAAPSFDVFAAAAATIPGLADWRLASFAAPLEPLMAQTVPALAGHAPAILFGGASVLGALIVYTLRSWRLVWAPLFVGAVGAGALGFNGADGAVGPALAGLGAGAGVFLLGGFFNRLRDAARLERRIAILADHMLRNAPEEMIVDVTASAHQSGAQTPAETVSETISDTVSETGPAADPDENSETMADGDAETAADKTVAFDAGVSAREDSLEMEGAIEAQADAEAAPPAEDYGPEIPASPSPEAGEPEPKRSDTLAQLAGATAASQTHAGAAGEHAADTPHIETGAALLADDASAPADPDMAGQADAAGPVTFEQEENERLRTDPRYAARAIVLPPPPPMPDPAEEAPRSQTRTLQPDGPLAPNVVPIFAASTKMRDEEDVN